jgi:hypothetical protein
MSRFRFCRKKMIGRGLSPEGAEMTCRGQMRPKTFIGKIQFGEGLAGDFGSGAGSQMRIGDLGTGRVVKADAKRSGIDWAQALARPVTIQDREAFRQYADSITLDPDEQEEAWRAAVAFRPGIQQEDVFATAVNPVWIGYSVPPFWGNMEMPRHVQDQLGPASFSGTSYKTEIAKSIWDAAQQLVLSEPTKRPEELIDMAFQKLKIDPQSIAPEDWQMLRMGLEWLQNGPAKTTDRSGGTPGGPMRVGTNRGAP